MKSHILFRALIPSWRFFDDISNTPTLFYALSTEKEIWYPLSKRKPRGFFSFFVNPAGGLYLAKQTLVENAVEDLFDMESLEVELSVSYQLLVRLVRDELRRTQKTGAFFFQVRVGQEVVLHSQIHDFQVGSD